MDGIGKLHNGFFNVDAFDHFFDVVQYVNIKLKAGKVCRRAILVHKDGILLSVYGVIA